MSDPARKQGASGLRQKIRQSIFPAAAARRHCAAAGVAAMAIRIGTSERDGTFYSQGVALKAVLERRPGLGAITVLESRSASMENANRLHRGEIELGFMASNWIGRAKNGEPPFTQPIDIRMVAPMNAGPLF